MQLDQARNHSQSSTLTLSLELSCVNASVFYKMHSNIDLIIITHKSSSIWKKEFSKIIVRKCQAAVTGFFLIDLLFPVL